MTSPPERLVGGAQHRAVALLLSVALHVLALALAGLHQFSPDGKPDARLPEEPVIFLEVTPAAPERTPSEPPAVSPAVVPAAPSAAPALSRSALQPAERQPAFMDAPPAPSTQEWALAASYTLKNSKRYRYT